MTAISSTYRVFTVALTLCFATTMAAQENLDSLFYIEPLDTIVFPVDEIDDIIDDAVPPIAAQKRQRRDWATWHPDPKRALWLALAIPGAGQIYNRKYWKLPIVYGGFVGCAYAMRWNNMMYHDYSQAYLDIMDDDPQTQSYNQFVRLGNKITDDNIDRWKTIFKKRKDRFRRWRDMSFFVMVGVYALSVIDAYVDASLSEFDISTDLSMRVTPAVINTDTHLTNGTSVYHRLQSTAVGLQCSLNF